MEIKIIFDRGAINHKFKTGWGFSCLINNHILFDTGADGDALLNNLHLMGISPSGIDKIIISHDHSDHAGGLWKIIEHQQDISVYICSNFNQSFKDKIEKFDNTIIDSHTFQEIDKQIYTTGEISGSYKNNFIAEQALVLKTSRGEDKNLIMQSSPEAKTRWINDNILLFYRTLTNTFRLGS